MKHIVSSIDWRIKDPGVEQCGSLTLQNINADLLGIARAVDAARRAHAVILVDNVPQTFLDLPRTAAEVDQLLISTGTTNKEVSVSNSKQSFDPLQYAAIRIALNLHNLAGEYGLDPESLPASQDDRIRIAARIIPFVGAGILANLLKGLRGELEQTVLIAAEFPLIQRTDSDIPLRMSGHLLRALFGKADKESVNSEATSPLFNSLATRLNLSGTSFFVNLPAPDSLLVKALGPKANYGFVQGQKGPCGVFAELGRLRIAFLDLKDSRNSGQTLRTGTPDEVQRTIFNTLGMAALLPDASSETEIEASLEEQRVREARLAKEDIEKSLSYLGKSNPLIGNSPAMLQLYPDILRSLLDRKLNVLLYGEVGTGKEVVCELLSAMDEKDTGNPLMIEATELSQTENIAVSRLFGIGQNQATGVDQSIGYIEESAEGTLVLDGMEHSAQHLQLMIRRAFDPDKRKYLRVGEKGEKEVRCRLVMTFNIPPEQLVEEGKLIPDLPSRVEVRLTIPPLRERKEDIPLIVRALVERRVNRLNLKAQPVIEDVMPPDSLIQEWSSRDWSDEDDRNVRGLRHEVYAYVDRRCRELGIDRTLADHTVSILQSRKKDVPQELMADGDATPKASPKAKGGRPVGTREIKDEDLVGLLKLFEERHPVMTLNELFEQIEKRNARITKTYGALERRVHSIDDKAISSKWPECDPKQKKSELTKLIRQRAQEEGIPKSKPNPRK